MKDAGIIKDYTMVVANNDVATQVQQIESFIMQGCNLIVVDPCSSSGLDGYRGSLQCRCTGSSFQ